MREPQRLFEIWAPPNAVFSPWAKPLLFAQMDTGRAVPPADHAPPAQPWAGALDARTAVILDLPGDDAVRHAAALATLGHRPVPLFNGSDGDKPAIDVRPVMLALRQATPAIERAPLTDQSPPVFMLDARRYSATSKPGPGWFDNRWVVFPQDFPSGRFLRAHAIERALLVRKGPWRTGDDLLEILARWAKDGVELLSAEADKPDAAPLRAHAPWGLRPIAALALVMLGLRANSAGGFGARVPTPSQSGGYG